MVRVKIAHTLCYRKPTIVYGGRKVSNRVFDVKQYAATARQAVAEGVILLKNDGQVLPLADMTKVAVFGRTQFNYYKSGTGSGGLVNTSYVMGILEALEQDSTVVVNQNLKKTYKDWLVHNPFDAGEGWAAEPWFQKEMPISDELVNSIKAESDAAIVIIGRTAGEDKDNKADEGSYYLNQEERNMLSKVCSTFEKTIVLLNVGNIIDMNWVKEYNPSAVLYVWQGGQEGGMGVLDVLRGYVSPSGKLTDTIAYEIEDYPSDSCYGDELCNQYIEDIYVGYRYFETFKKDRVMYPFGFGLSYTTFSMNVSSVEEKKEELIFSVKVTNTGSYKGKEVVQLYVEAPQGELGKPAKSLCGFAKTKELQAGESETVTITVPKYMVSSYDDSGATGHKSSYVLEAGNYTFWIGSDVRETRSVHTMEVKTLEVIETLEEAMAPVVDFKRMRPAMGGNSYEVSYEAVPKRTISPSTRRLERMPAEIPYTGDKGIKLSDVASGNATMESFIGQLSDEDLFCIARGEGMSSPKVTPGTAGAFGGVTDSLLGFGIPVACCADGPSGVRMDCGTIAFALPNGTCLASTFNTALIGELFEYEGMELRKNQVDTLLGAGMNIHRHPLNGRNFEYFSEDPLLTGKIAAAQLNGMHKYGVTGTIKHYACNNQEFKRTEVETVISERALREIYLKGFEIAVKESSAYSIMTSYNPINGLWAASNYDLLTTILRKEWGFDGIVMTDWWAKGNDEGELGTVNNSSAMIRSQNDLAMVTANALENTSNDNSKEGLEKGWIERAEFQRTAINICKALLKFPVFARSQGIVTELDKMLAEVVSEENGGALPVQIIEMEDTLVIAPEKIVTNKGADNLFQIVLKTRGTYQISVTCKANAVSDIAQIPLSIFIDKKLEKTITLVGEDKEWATTTFEVGPFFNNNFYLKLYFGQTGMEIKDVVVSLKESYEERIKAHLAGQN